MNDVLTEKDRQIYSYEFEGESVRIIEAGVNKMLIKLKLNDHDQLLNYCVSNGVLFISPAKKTVTYINRTPHYSFYWHCFQHTSIKRVIIHSDTMLFAVPYKDFIMAAHVQDNMLSLSKLLHIPYVALRDYLVQRYV